MAPAAQVTGLSELIGDERHETARDRFERKDEINAMLEPWTMSRTKAKPWRPSAAPAFPAAPSTTRWSSARIPASRNAGFSNGSTILHAGK